MRLRNGERFADEIAFSFAVRASVHIHSWGRVLDLLDEAKLALSCDSRSQAKLSYVVTAALTSLLHRGASVVSSSQTMLQCIRDTRKWISDNEVRINLDIADNLLALTSEHGDSHDLVNLLRDFRDNGVSISTKSLNTILKKWDFTSTLYVLICLQLILNSQML